MKSKLDSMETERQRIVLTYTKGYIDEAEFDLKMKSINERKEMLESELSEMEGSAGEYERQLEALENFTHIASAIRGRLPNLSDDERKDIVCALVSKVTVGEEINLKMAIGHAPVIDDSKVR